MAETAGRVSLQYSKVSRITMLA